MRCDVPTKVGQASRLSSERVSASVKISSIAPTSPARAGETPALLSAWRDSNFAPLMVRLRATEFIMGENAGDKFATDTERPAHRVRCSESFALGRYPITVGEFRHLDSRHAPDEEDDLPVVRVSWQDATAYCEWLTEQTGRPYRLPSEAEWEFACRAGSRTPFSVGDELTTVEANFLYDEIGMRIGLGARSRAGNYPANQFGLHDLHGNVCEWVADTWHQDYHGAPANCSAWIDASDSRHVIRGGAWDYLPRLLRSAWRDWRPADFRADNIGFRVATSDFNNLPEAAR